MLDFDASCLRAQVISDFEFLTRDVTDATELNRFTDAVMHTAVGAVRERLHLFNQQNAAAHLPAKLLAACFAHLPVYFCIRGSHVCRSWRTAAVAEPSLWTHISPWSRSSSGPELLEMALSRVGALPIDVLVDTDVPTDLENAYNTVAQFSHRLRYLAWYSECPSRSWDFPAPNLEGFCCAHTLTITPDFLGGQRGRLRCLYLQCVYLPPSCPALCNVTELSVRLAAYDRDAAPSTLENLFDLLPCLKWLNVMGITSGTATMLPAGPAPTSLTELELDCDSPGYDLMPHYLSWDTGNIRHVSLSQQAGTDIDLAPLASGTTRLAVRYAPKERFTSLMFEHPDGVSHSITLSELRIADAAALLIATLPSLAAVHTVIVSHLALHHLTDVLTSLPSVEHLVVHIVPKNATAAAHIGRYPSPFDWRPLSSLSDVAGSIPALRYITLQVWCGLAIRRSYLKAEHARGLLEQLRALIRGRLPPIEIQGFPAEAVASVDLTGLNVRFDVVAPVGELVLHMPRELYYPFP